MKSKSKFTIRSSRLIYFLLVCMLITPLISAEPSYIYKQNTIVNLKVPVTNSDNSIATSSVLCNITIKYPEETILVDNGVMEYNEGGVFNYTLSNLYQIGEYSAFMSCTDGVEYGFTTFSFEVTPSGFTGTLGFFILILCMSAGLIVLGFAIKDAWITIFGTFGLYFLGLYILLNGIVGVKDMVTTWAMGLICLGIAGYISINSAIEVVQEYL